MVSSAQGYDTRRFTADEVMRMVDAGVLSPDERVELIEGELVVVTPQGPVHSTLTVLIHAVLQRAYGGGFHVRDHSPVAGTVDSIPEPDVAVVRGDARSFLAALPGPADVILVVEVAHTSLAMDRRKASVYASAGYETYWLLDVESRRLEVRVGRTADGLFTKTEIFADDAEVILPGTSSAVRIADLLP